MSGSSSALRDLLTPRFLKQTKIKPPRIYSGRFFVGVGKVEAINAAGWNTCHLSGVTGLQQNGLANAIFPVSRFPVAVHYSHDKNVICFDGVENCIRKYARQISAYILFKWFPLFRFLDNTLNSMLNRVDKTLPETGLATLIISGRILVFFQSFGMKFISHFLMACLTCAKATSPGIVLTRPLRTSSRRRHASLIQS